MLYSKSIMPVPMKLFLSTFLGYLIRVNQCLAAAASDKGSSDLPTCPKQVVIGNVPLLVCKSVVSY